MKAKKEVPQSHLAKVPLRTRTGMQKGHQHKASAALQRCILYSKISGFWQDSAESRRLYNFKTSSRYFCFHGFISIFDHKNIIM